MANKLKALLPGASGQLGTEWQYALANQDDWLLLPYTSDQLDITQAEQVKHEIEEQQPDLIINCAAYTKVDQAEEEIEKARKVNAVAVKNLAECCSRYDVKLIHFSTDYIFAGRAQDREQFPNGYPEDHRADPVNAYGLTKWEGEEAIRNSGCRHLILRVSWLCGAYGGNFVKSMLRLADEHDQLRVVDDQLGSPTFTDSLVDNTLMLIKSECEGTFHSTSGGLLSWADLAAAIFEMSGKEVEVNRIPSAEYPTPAARPFFSKLNTEKIEGVNGIEIEGWKAGLGRLLNQLD
jgi:dTDP-4-dehydrorhamnose reductase